MLQIFRLEFSGHALPRSLFLGEWIHGWLFRCLMNIDAEMATRWHEGVSKPFSLSYKIISGHGNSSEGSILLELAALTPEAASAFAQLHRFIGGDCRLGQSAVTLTGMSMTEPQFYSELIHSPSAKEAGKMTMECITPVSFRDHGIQTIFPEPGLVWGSLYRRWLEMANVPLPEAPDWDRTIVVNQFTLESRITLFKNYKLIGAVGHIGYRWLTKDPQLQIVASALALFSNYAGVGYKTTMGLGHVRVRV